MKTYDDTFVQGIVELFHPFVEGVVHDLRTGTVSAVFNNISRRKVGDVSPLHELKVAIDAFPDYFPPYYRTNWDGRKLKCISFTRRDEKKKPIALICFNFDVSFFQDIEQRFSSLLQLPNDNASPLDLFGPNWQTQVQEQINHYLSLHSLLLHQLNKSQKQKLVEHLYKKGLFNYKNAAPFIADHLGISKATLYNYMNEIK